MARSLSLSTDTINVGIEGTINDPIKINVTVDGANDNASFTVSALNDDWFTYSIERYLGQVIISVSIQKNLSTQERYGSITVTHNCVSLAQTVNIIQSAVEYALTNNEQIYYHSFSSMPTNNAEYEDFRIRLTAVNGRGKWYVKDIRQYQVGETDKFNDEEYMGLSEQDNEMVQSRVTYDNVFNYYVEGDELVVRSYGQIDLTNSINSSIENANPHMRYFFVVSHSDVNNNNKIWMDEKEVYYNQEKRYEDKILFVFDKNNGSGYSDDETPDANPITPSEGTNYVFLVNNSKNLTLNFESDETTQSLTITSTKNGNEIDYDVQTIPEWCTFNGNTLVILENEDYDYRQGKIILQQNESNNTVTINIAQNGATKAYVFTLVRVTASGEEAAKEIETYDEENPNIYKVISTYGINKTPYTITNISSTKWIGYAVNNNNEYTFTAQENTSYDQRQTTYALKQTNSNNLIYLTIVQDGMAESNVFEVYFTDDKTTEKNISESSQELSLTIVSTKNGVFEEYTFDGIKYYNSDSDKWVDGNDWLEYKELSNTIIVSEYGYDNERINNNGADNDYSATAKLSFTREINKKAITIEILITQKKQEVNSILYIDDSLTIGYEGGYYSEPYGKLYSYIENNGIKTPVKIENIYVTKGSFIVDSGIKLSEAKKDDNGYYYEVTITVTTNETEEVRNGAIRFSNQYGQTCEMNVEQRKNGEIVLTAFDYIVMNYTWTDYVDENSNVYPRNFDSVMYFDTKAIGDMYQECACFSMKEIQDKNSEGEFVTYAELAYDQIKSTIGDIDRIETQVIYLKNLKDDGYLQKIKEASEDYLTIQLYGNLFNVEETEYVPISDRITVLSIHTYLGGIMERNDDEKTMENIGGIEVNVGIINDVTYNITSINNIGGAYVDIVTSNFQHLGTLQYNVKDKTAIFTPVNS